MEVQRTNLTENAEKRLARGEVTVQKTNGTTFGMVQMLTITNMVGAQAHLARVGTPMAREGKYTDARLLKMASFGVLCPSTTPEGKDVGLIESLSLGVHVRFHTPTSTMLETLRDGGIRERQDGGRPWAKGVRECRRYHGAAALGGIAACVLQQRHCRGDVRSSAVV